MSLAKRFFRMAACAVLTVAVAGSANPALAGDFAAFGQDEDVCRQVGAASIQGATGPAAAERYDFAHARCMEFHGRARMMNAYRNAGQPGEPIGNPPGEGYPDAFFAIPYATPGYGYDGFTR